MRKLPAYDPYLDTILCIRSAHHSPDEEAALIQNVFDALHLVQHRRPKKERDLPDLLEIRRLQRKFIPALPLFQSRVPEVCHA